MRSVRSVFIPSKREFHRFSEFNNNDLYAMLASSDSLVDNMQTQRDIITANLVGDALDISTLTILDYFVIFLSWRINSMDEILHFNDGEIEITKWLASLSELDMGKMNTTIQVGDVTTIQCGTPYMDTIINIYQSQMVVDDSSRVKDTNTHMLIFSKAVIHTIGGNVPSQIELDELFGVLPPELTARLFEFSNEVKAQMEEIDITTGTTDDAYQLSMESIPIVISGIFSGETTDILHQSLFLSKKGNISVADFMNLTPRETKYLLEYLRESEKEPEVNLEAFDEEANHFDFD